jgi:hypothetical protein
MWTLGAFYARPWTVLDNLAVLCKQGVSCDGEVANTAESSRWVCIKAAPAAPPHHGGTQINTAHMSRSSRLRHTAVFLAVDCPARGHRARAGHRTVSGGGVLDTVPGRGPAAGAALFWRVKALLFSGKNCALPLMLALPWCIDRPKGG